ncbi:unnamed protein product [Cuscuta epithymum]|uniref:Uncharacterized protein n=1 Tax=Cuscuta epithymum TaxID=186058 RepID=A0AAV0G8Z8_9ASTE|nr:unnamed protein product [Cuscuta epithymum]CAH9144455.1 unnamed protein product [Cuscuta epithymum]
MGLFRKLAGFLGFVKDEAEQVHEENGNGDANPPYSEAAVEAQAHHLPRKGFSIPIQVQAEKPALPGPIISPCTLGDGGVQGLRWYGKGLKVDEDGDVADEFISEIPPENLGIEQGQKRQFPRFEVKYQTRQAKVRNQALLSPDGKIQLFVELHGRLEWI